MANIIRAASRRDVLKIAGLAGAGAMLGRRAGRAAPKSMTMMHESSFIPAYDAYLQEHARPGL